MYQEVSSPISVGFMMKWLVPKINALDDGRAKFCALNAIRFLDWANQICEISPVASSFCALHATEEAVTALISAAKSNGLSQTAKYINLHDHSSKALVSIYAQRCSQILSQGDVAMAFNLNKNCLAFRRSTADGYHYGDLHVGTFRLHSNDEGDIEGFIKLGDAPSLEEIHQESKKVASARNELLYATEHGYPTGFDDPRTAIERETNLSLAIIWATLDIIEHPCGLGLVEDVLSEMKPI